MRTYRTLALGAAMLALVLSACSSGGSGTSQPSAGSKPVVKIGSAGFYEAEVVGEIYAQALEAAAVHAALSAGDVNLIPEYLGGLAGQGLGLETLPSDPQQAVDNMQSALADKGWVIFDYSPGTDADGFAVRKETADQYGLATMTDLAAVADQLVWGVAQGCPTNPVCGPGLKTTYGIDLSQLQVETLSACSADIAGSLNDGTIDVAQVCTTQPEIASMNLVLMDDDKHLQPAQNMVPLATKALADAAPADFAATLNAIQAKLSTEALTELGVAINVNHEDVADVAAQFLQDNGLV
jgi:osmoprotectant transport system substrate-binding protein